VTAVQKNGSLFIRADATTQIGTGHIMRCIALAQAWQDHGGKVTFLSHCESEALRQRILDEGFDFIPIEKPYLNPYDLGEMLKCFSAIRNWVVLDGYHFNQQYQKKIRETGYQLMVIDDSAHLARYHCDILVNQNIQNSEFRYDCVGNTVKLLGPRYALLRREFLEYRGVDRKTSEKARNFLITLGGADPDNVTLKVIKALNMLKDPDIDIRIVVGPSNPHKEILKNAVHHAPYTMRLLDSVEDMCSVIAWADLAVSAGGSTCWELAIMGVPFVTIILAENQENIATGLEKAGAALNAGWHHILTEKNLSILLKELAYNIEVRSAFSVKGKELVDGKGVLRVIEEIGKNSR